MPALEHGNSLLDISFGQVEASGPVKCQTKTERVIEGLGDLDRLFCASSALGEHTQLGQARGQKCAAVHGWERGLPEALTSEITRKGRDRPSQSIHSEAILAGSVLGLTQIGAGHDLEPDIPYGRGERTARWPEASPCSFCPIMEKWIVM